MSQLCAMAILETSG